MDPVRNPFAPGAGNQPPELAGRDAVLEDARTMLARLAQSRHVRSPILIGLRGVGKTVLLNRIRQIAETSGVHAFMFEAPEDKDLPELLVPPLRRLLHELDLGKAAVAVVQRGLRILAGFAKAWKVKYEGVEIGVESGVADSQDLDHDLPDLLVAVAEAAKARKKAVVLIIDELQYVKEAQLGALVMAIHKVSQLQLPLNLVAAGLPQVIGNLGRAKSYAERLFSFIEIGALSAEDAAAAISGPIVAEHERIDKSAVDAIVRATNGYPFFLQTWGAFVWNEAKRSPISLKDVTAAQPRAMQDLDVSFFRVRLDRMTPSEKRYLRAMAELGPGPHRSGDIASELHVKVQSVAPVRSSLIKKGMIYSKSHGETAFTVPMFDEFMRRQMPDKLA